MNAREHTHVEGSHTAPHTLQNTEHSVLTPARPLPYLALPAKGYSEKGIKAGEKFSVACGRALQALLCPLGALGRHLAQTFTIDAAPLPDPANPSEWKSWHIWPGESHTRRGPYKFPLSSAHAIGQHELGQRAG